MRTISPLASAPFSCLNTIPSHNPFQHHLSQREVHCLAPVPVPATVTNYLEHSHLEYQPCTRTILNLICHPQHHPQLSQRQRQPSPTPTTIPTVSNASTSCPPQSFQHQPQLSPNHLTPTPAIPAIPQLSQQCWPQPSPLCQVCCLHIQSSVLILIISAEDLCVTCAWVWVPAIWVWVAVWVIKS